MKLLEVKNICIDYENIDYCRSNLQEIFLKINGAKFSEAEQ